MKWFLIFFYVPTTLGGQTPQLTFFPLPFETAELCEWNGEGIAKRVQNFRYFCWNVVGYDR